MIDISILKIKLFFFISKLLQHHSSTLTMTDIMNDRYLHPQNEIDSFISKLLQHHSSTRPITDIMNDRHIHSQNEIIFFYFETITASFQHLDQRLI